MEVSYISTIAVFCCGTVVVIWAWRALNWVWFRPKKLEKRLREQGFKGNSYRLLYGDTKQMINMLKEANSKPINFSDDIATRVIPLHQETFKKYGKNSFYWLGPIPSVLIMNPELIKEITLKYTAYEKPHANPLTKLLLKGVVNYEGDKWAKHRRIINPAFQLEKLKHMLPAFYTSACEILSKWEEIVSPGQSCEVDVWPYLQTLTSDAISRTAFGSNYEEGRRIFKLQKEQAENFIKVNQSVYIPGWRFLPTKINRRMKRISKDVNNSIRRIINSRIEAMRAGEGSENDLLGILLESNSKETDYHGKKEFGLTIEDVIEECKLFYFAGQETTSALLTFTMILLSQHPNWQTRAREEVFQILGTNKPGFDGLNHLKIVTMILHEVLRLYPSIAAIPRRAAEETKLGDFTIPAGVLISLPTMIVQHDPELWGDDVEEFKPERFADGVSNATKGQVSFFPFGWGPRICIGQNFAMLEAKMAMALILQNFSFELSPSYVHAPISIVTLQPQHGAHLILHKI